MKDNRTQKIRELAMSYMILDPEGDQRTPAERAEHAVARAIETHDAIMKIRIDGVAPYLGGKAC